MQLSDFDYHLPKNLIAQKPIFPRDHSRLMILDRQHKTWQHNHFYNLVSYLKSSDVLVFNQSKVIPARLFGRKESGGKLEILLLRKINSGQKEVWESLTRPGLKKNNQTARMEGNPLCGSNNVSYSSCYVF